jgi:SAM-dependent methyltransferase
MGEIILCDDIKSKSNKQLQEWNKRFLSCGCNKPKLDDWLDKFMYILEQSKDVPIVDLGCGYGNDTLYLCERGYKVISCDYSEEALKRLQYFIPDPDTRLFNMLDGLPFPNDSVKVLIADLSLHYFSSEDTCRVIKDISRVLTTGGTLICRVNSVDDIEFGAGQGIRLEDNFYDIDGKLKRFFDRKQIDCFFSDWGMEHVCECEMNRYPKLKRVWEIAAMNVKK